MARPKVKMSRAGAIEILNDPKVRAELRRRAEGIADRARATAPVQSGRYRDGITVVETTTQQFGDTRPSVRVGSTAPHAHLVEARTGNLARALGSEGG